MRSAPEQARRARLLAGTRLPVLAVAAHLLAASSALPATTVIDTILAGCSSTGVAVNPITNKIYVANSNDATVAVIDGNTNAILTTIPLVTEIAGVAVNTVTNKVYVAHFAVGTGTTVRVINGATDTVLGSIPLTAATAPLWIGVNTVTNKVYVSAQASNNVAVINGATDTWVSNVAMGGVPGGVGVHTGTNRIYVGVGAPVQGVRVIDGTTDTVATTIAGMSDPNDVVVDSVQNRAYVANQGDNTLKVINTATDTVLSSTLVGNAPSGVAVNASLNHAYTTNNGASSVSVVNVTAGVIHEPDVGVQLSPTDADFNSETGLLYVTNTQSCTVSVLQDTSGVCEDPDSSHWWNSAWRRRRPLTLDNATQLETLSNFPVLIRLDSSRIDYTRTQNAGQDLRFVDADDLTLLDHEIELWNEAGTSYVWVRVPTIIGTGRRTIYMYFDNAGAPDGQSPAAVWDASFSMVQHLRETVGAHLDSTANNNDSVAIDVATQGAAVGQIDGADLFAAASNDNVDVATAASLNVGAGESVTVEAFIRTSAAVDQMVVSKEDTTGEYQLWTSGGNARFWVNDGTDNARANSATPVANNAFHYVVGRFDRASSTAAIFVDGLSVATNTNALVGALTSPRPLVIGEEGDVNGGFNFDGIIDEVRVSKAARSNDWIRAQNLSMTDRFVTFGAETGACNLRSIGTRPNYGTVQPQGAATTVTTFANSRTVLGAGTTWRSSNRGRGDSISIGAFVSTILSVDSETVLTLVHPFSGVPGAGQTYSIARKFPDFPEWEDCLDGGGTACGPDPVVPSASLVADNRGEIGIAYRDSTFLPSFGTHMLEIDGSTTDATHTITLTADPGNRHLGIAGNGVVLDGVLATDSAILVFDDFVTVEWLEFTGGDPNFDGVEWQNIGAVNKGVARNLLIYNLGDTGIQIQDNQAIVDIYNNVVYASRRGIRNVSALTTGRLRILNNTIYGNTVNGGITASVVAPGLIMLRNNIAHSNVGGDFSVPSPHAASSHNLASDLSGTTHSPGGGGLNSVPLTGGGGVNFVSTTPGSENLHLQGTSVAVNAGASLTLLFDRDIDAVIRLNPWEIGADDTSQTTAVALQAFTASGADAAVDLRWNTASELQNLGFHLYRSLSPDGPWDRITSSLIPGLGSSPTGASYAFRDSGLANGTTYRYLLEDVETTGRTQRHGPVSATPQAGASNGGEGAGGGSDEGADDRGDEGGSPGDPGRITWGRPDAASLQVLERGPAHVVVELLTPGLTARTGTDGAVRIDIPGFEHLASPGAIDVPVRPAVVEALAGRRVVLSSVTAQDLVTFDSFRLRAADSPDVVVTDRGIVKAGASPRRLPDAHRRGGFAPRLWARLAGNLFQGETKKARLELAPLRHDPGSGRTILARRLVVRLDFTGKDAMERSLGSSRGRRPSPGLVPTRGVVAQLVASETGLHRVRFEDVFAAGHRGVRARHLRLSRLGEAVAYHIEPDLPLFGPGSRLYFVAENSGSLHDRGEAVYELSLGPLASRMAVVTAAPAGPPVTEHMHTRSAEENHFYQAALLGASDLWLWDLLVSPVVRSYPFAVEALSAGSTSARLRVVLQGGSDLPEVDHHVRLSVNGIPVGEATWDGKVEQVVEVEVGAGILAEGANSLGIENVGDAGAAYSMVFLNRFEVSYPRLLTAPAGRLEGRFDQSGRALVSGLVGPGPTVLLDTTGLPVWLTSAEATPTGLAFRAESGRSYLAQSDAAVRAPVVRAIAPGHLRSASNRAHWILVAPREFLPAATPLRELRRRQGLLARTIALEDVAAEFGFGEASPRAIRDFLAYAFHHWKTGPRYVVLLGDTTYDPRNHLGTGVRDRVPSPLVATSYLWTVSDPSLAAVNGDDLVPDLAIGRLSAGSRAEAERLVRKLVAFEEAGRTFDGRAVLVADNGDAAGGFEADQDEVAASVLGGREVLKVYLRDLGAATRPTIRAAFDAGPGLVSYVGHGATAVWASENVWNNTDVAGLSAQDQQPLLFTLNCLNGFFHFPSFDSLAEAMVKAEGRGALAALAPSGLSLDAPAHLYHKALLQELEGRSHERLGDVLLAAQEAYADTGAMPELLSIYHLFGDPGLRVR